MTDGPVTAPDHETTAVPVGERSTGGSEGTSDTRLPYHRLAHQASRTAQWWRPFATLGVSLGLYIASLIPLVTVAVVYAVLGMSLPGLPGPSEDLADPLNPFDWVSTLGLLALMIPAVILGTRWGGGRRGSVHSVVGRFRWGLLGRAAVFIVPIYAVMVLGLALIDPPDDFAVPTFTPSLVLCYVLILVLAPLQCAAEEYAFRGLPQQMLGTWLKSPLWGIVLPVPIFVLGHGYDWAGQVSVGVFALSTGFMVWKSGGLELPILIHTANNLFIFLVAPFSRSSLEQGAVDPTYLLIDIPFMVGITALLTWWVSRREGVGLFEPVPGRGDRVKKIVTSV